MIQALLFGKIALWIVAIGVSILLIGVISSWYGIYKIAKSEFPDITVKEFFNLFNEIVKMM